MPPSAAVIAAPYGPAMSMPSWKYGALEGQLYPGGGDGSPGKDVQPKPWVMGPSTPGQAKTPEEWARPRAASSEAISAATSAAAALAAATETSRLDCSAAS